MAKPITTVPQRSLGYKFAAAEAAWILSGDNRVSTIAPYSKSISGFSDDGFSFFGSYGPPIRDQIGYVCKVLAKDPDTRQAVLTIWRQNPPQSSDVPCTISLQWLIRDNKLFCIDTMRSSDLYLGWVYDVINMSLLSHYIRLRLRISYGMIVGIGDLILTAGSSHLYEPRWAIADQIIKTTGEPWPNTPSITDAIDRIKHPEALIEVLWQMAEDKGVLEGFQSLAGE